MAGDPANGINWYLSIPANSSYQSALAPIRHWTNLTLAVEDGMIWVGGFTPVQIESLAVKTIPFKTRYREEAGLLFPFDKILPARKAPAYPGLPIEKALPLHFPAFNAYFFGFSEASIQIRLVPAAEERPAAALLASLAALASWIETAPAPRLKPLSWTIINEENAFFLGDPLLPLPGEAFWQRGPHLLPLGREFELPILENAIARQLSPANDHWIVWRPQGNYFLIPKTEMQALSISSFRKTLK